VELEQDAPLWQVPLSGMRIKHEHVPTWSDGLLKNCVMDPWLLTQALGNIYLLVTHLSLCYTYNI